MEGKERERQDGRKKERGGKERRKGWEGREGKGEGRWRPQIFHLHDAPAFIVYLVFMLFF